MCVVSVMVDYFDRAGPPPGEEPFQFPSVPSVPPVPSAPPPVWDRESFELLKRAMAILEKLDAKLGEPECSDPRKAEFLKRIEARLEALEAKRCG